MKNLKREPTPEFFQSFRECRAADHVPTMQICPDCWSDAVEQIQIDAWETSQAAGQEQNAQRVEATKLLRATVERLDSCVRDLSEVLGRLVDDPYPRLDFETREELAAHLLEVQSVLADRDRAVIAEEDSR